MSVLGGYGSKRTRSVHPKTKRRFRYLIPVGGLLFFATLASCIVAFNFVLAPEENFFNNLASSLIISWVSILTLYYMWALQFYIIQRSAEATAPISPLDAPAPDVREHSDQTFGLPPGTVRGTLALSILVSGLALAIASLAMPPTLKAGEIWIDHFKFLKTGFVMMIACYFGSRSLAILRGQNAVANKDHEVNTSPEANPDRSVNHIGTHHLPNQILKQNEL